MNVYLYSRLSYLACKSIFFCSALHCNLWHVWLYLIFPHSREQLNFRKKITANKMGVFSLQHLSETYLILRRTEQDMIKNLYRSSHKVSIIQATF